MAFCENCGNEIVNEAKFCTHCGAPLKSNQDRSGSAYMEPQGRTGRTQGALDPAYRSVYQDAAPSVTDAAFDKRGQKADPPGSRKKPAAAILPGIAALIAVLIAAVFFLLPSGWSKEDAQNATQAYLDYLLFKGEAGELAKYIEDPTEEELSGLRMQERDEMIDSNFESGVPVTNELKERYADFQIELLKKTRCTAGEAVKTKDGFEVPVSVEPVISLAEGDYVLLDLQLNEDLSDAELNERVYSRELQLMQELLENPSYGDLETIVMHISKGEDGLYIFSEEDLGEILNTSFVLDRHWNPVRAKGAVEAVLSGIFEQKYTEMSEWTFATEEEIRQEFDVLFSKEAIRDEINESGAQIIKRQGLNINYSVPDVIVDNIAEAYRRLMMGTKHEVVEIRGDRDEYVAVVRITPFSASVDELIQEGGERLSKEIGSFSNINSFIDRLYELLTELVVEKVVNGNFGKPFEYELHLKYNENKAYELNAGEVYGLFDLYNSSEAGE